MGQYFVVANLDKKEFLEPHDFGQGAKLMEFALSPGGITAGLSVLLSTGGGGCRASRTSITGRWAGDRIAVVGDYSDEYPTSGTDGWVNISDRVLGAVRGLVE